MFPGRLSSRAGEFDQLHALDKHEIEQTIVQSSPGGDFHALTENAAVGDRADQVAISRELAPVDIDADTAARIADHSGNEATEIGRSLAGETLFIHPPDHFPSESEIRHVEEKRSESWPADL